MFVQLHPSETSTVLVERVRAQQDTIYTLCRKILHHPQDAEDACQEVFVEVLRCTRTFQDETHFKRWLYRVTLHAALQLRRKNDRRRDREQQVLRSEDARQDADLQDCVLGALADLDDEARGVLVEHYIAGRTLEDLAQEYGCSTVAVWKRIAKIKDRLKAALLRRREATAAPCLELFLESIHPRRAPARLFENVIPKAAMTGGAIAMGTKSLLALGTAALLLFLVVGSVQVNRSRAEARRLEDELQKSQAELQALRAEAAGGGRSLAKRRTSEGAPNPGAGTDTGASNAGSAAKLSSATAGKDVPSAAAAGGKKLAQFLAKLRERAKKKTPLYEVEWLDYLAKEARDLQAMIAEDPNTFLGYLRSPENEDPYILQGLLLLLNPPFKFDRDGATTRPGRAADLPDAVRQGLLELLKTGSTEQRASTLDFLKILTDLGEEFHQTLLSLLAEGEPKLRLKALDVLNQGQEFWNRQPIPASHYPYLREACEKSDDRSQKAQCLMAIAAVKTSEADEYFFGRVSSAIAAGAYNLAGTESGIVSILAEKLSHASAENLPRYATYLNAAFKDAREPIAFGQLAAGTLSLSTPYALQVLESVAGAAPTPGLREALDQVIGSLRRGDADGKSLREVLRKATWGP